MTTGIAQQLDVLRRIAAFSAAVRGHQLGAWQTGEGRGQATCVNCGAELRVYFPSLQPEMDGPALERDCNPQAVAEQAA